MHRIRDRRLPAVLLALVLTAAAPLAGAQSAAPKAPPAPSAAPIPMLWKVSDKDNSLYLLGSFHLLGQEDAVDDPDVEAAFADAEALVFEASPADMADMAGMAKAMQAVSGYAPGHSYQSVMPAALRAKLEAMTKAAGQDPATLSQSEPWQVGLGITVGIAQSLGFKPEYGLDKRFMARAAQAGKPASGLETVAEQLQALDSTPYPEQVAGLQEFFDDPPGMIQQMRDMHATWRAGDVDGLDALMRVEMAGKTPKTYRRVVVDRNAAWLPKLEARLKQPGTDDTLVVVGALHLLGRDGVVQQLRAKGYRVQRICSRCTAAPGAASQTRKPRAKGKP